MKWAHRFIANVKLLFGKSRFEREMKEEMDLHYEMEIQDQMGRGLSVEEAKRAVRHSFGSIDRYQEDCRDAFGIRILHDFIDDLRYGLRQLWKQKVFTAISLLTLAFCIGANGAVFSLVHAIWYRPYTYPDLERVVNLGMIWRNLEYGDSVQEISPRNYLDIEELATSFEALGFHQAGKSDLHLGDRAVRIDQAAVTPGIWNVARVQPLLGRFFSEDDLRGGNEQLAVLSYGLWRELFSGSDSVVGSKIKIDDETLEILGVAPPGFHLIRSASRLWMPKIFNEEERSENSRGMHGFQALARLTDGISIDQARQELKVIYNTLLDNRPDQREMVQRTGENFDIAPLGDWVSDRSSGPMVMSVQGATALILLIGCLNIAGILLVRGQGRRQEMAMRHALGASRWRIARQILTETILLFLIGGFLGIWVARASLSFLPGLIGYGKSLQHGGAVEMNYTVLLFTVATALVAGLIAGSLPAITVAKETLHNTLQTLSRSVTHGRHRLRLQNVFVVIQVAFALVLLTGAGVLVRNIWGLLAEGFGCTVENRIVVTVDLPHYRFGTGAADTLRKINPLKESLLQNLKALPGVRSAGLANRVPLADYNASKNSYSLDHYTPGPGEVLLALWYQVDPGYFDAIGVPILTGRGFRDSDSWQTQRVVVISEEIAKRYFQDRDPIGANLRFWNRDCRIVGIAGETMDVPLHWGDAPTLYFPYTQWHVTRFVENVSFVIHSELPVESLAAPIRQTLSAIDPLLTFEITTLEGIRDRAMITRRAPMETARIFALAAILLTALGIYGVLAASVAERTREIGIRMSLGAARGSIVRMILTRGGWLSLIGIGAGLIISLVPLVWLNPLLTGVDTTSPDLLIASALVVLAIVLLASYVPARRALAIDPVKTLRYE